MTTLDQITSSTSPLQVINATINKGPANNTEACLQHEITRLTGENFDLREKIENLGDTIKRLKRQLKAYMRKLNEAGVSDVKFDFNSEDLGKGVAAAADAADANASAGGAGSLNNNVVIRKKASTLYPNNLIYEL